MLKYPLYLLMVFPMIIAAQVDTTSTGFQITAYADVYYAYDFNQPEDHNRPPFLYSHNRHNEFNLNLGFVKGAYTSEKVRANLALGTGTYMNANYATEPGVLKNIYEANAGVKLSKRNNLWVDAGIFGSHIGFEGAVSKDCWGLTRSLVAESSPYYEAGAKITYVTNNNTWLLSGLILNGWQHIHRPDGNNTVAFGSQILFTPSEKFTFNYSTFIGNDKPDIKKLMRYFHDVYAMYHLSEKLHLTAGFDFGMEQQATGSSDYNQWYGSVLVARYIFDNQWSVTGRVEYYHDPKGVIIATETENGFQTIGYSLNVDYHITENAVWRIEGRIFKSEDKIFTKETQALNTNSCVTTSLAVSF